jgi:hypothetical protein
MIREKLIERCRDEQATYAVETLAAPGDMSSQTYAYRAGFFAGLRQAESLIAEVLEEDNDERADRQPSFA